MILSKLTNCPQPLKPLLNRMINMLWIMILLVIFVGTPMLLFSLAALATEIGLTATVTIGFVLVIAARVISLPAMLSMAATTIVAWIGYKMINKPSREGS